MQIQKQVSKKVGDKVYYKYVLVIPNKVFVSSDINEGDEVEAVVQKGEIKLIKMKKKNG